MNSVISDFNIVAKKNYLSQISDKRRMCDPDPPYFHSCPRKIRNAFNSLLQDMTSIFGLLRGKYLRSFQVLLGKEAIRANQGQINAHEKNVTRFTLLNET